MLNSWAGPLIVLAQLPDVNPQSLGNFLIAGAAVMAVALLGKQLIEKPKEDRPIRQSELDRRIAEMLSRSEAAATYAGRAELRELSEVTRSRIHDLSDNLQVVAGKVAILDHRVTEEIGPRVERVESKLDANHELLVRVATKLEIDQ